MRLGVGAALVDGAMVPGDVHIADDGTIAEVGVGPVDSGSVSSHVAVPGLVDLQVNGFAGIDFRHADPDDYLVAGAALGAHGATAVQPTLYGMSIDGYLAALDVLSEVDASRSAGPVPSGCRFLRAHLEGPFLNPLFKGAHDDRTFVAPSLAVADRLIDTGRVGFMTVAGTSRWYRPCSTPEQGAWSSASVTATRTPSRPLQRSMRGASPDSLLERASSPHVADRAGSGGIGPTGPDRRLIVDGVHVADEIVRFTLHAAAGGWLPRPTAHRPAGATATVQARLRQCSGGIAGRDGDGS